jgi:hypothetical protein
MTGQTVAEHLASGLKAAKLAAREQLEHALVEAIKEYNLAPGEDKARWQAMVDARDELRRFIERNTE